MSGIEVLPDGRVREGISTYGKGHAVYTCQSGKSPDCTIETRGAYSDGLYGYKGEVDTDPEKKMQISKQRPDYRSVALCDPCFTWEYWLDRIKADSSAPERVVIVDGRHYVIDDENKPRFGSFRGFGGSKFVIRFFDGREVTSTNLWAQDEIPEAFRDRLPDNAEFVR